MCDRMSDGNGNHLSHGRVFYSEQIVPPYPVLFLLQARPDAAWASICNAVRCVVGVDLLVLCEGRGAVRRQ